MKKERKKKKSRKTNVFEWFSCFFSILLICFFWKKGHTNSLLIIFMQKNKILTTKIPFTVFSYLFRFTQSAWTAWRMWSSNHPVSGRHCLRNALLHRRLTGESILIVLFKHLKYQKQLKKKTKNNRCAERETFSPYISSHLIVQSSVQKIISF